MFNRLLQNLRHFDWILLSAVLLLVVFGLVEIYSIALGQDTVDLLNFKKQLIFVAVGIVLLFAFSYFDYSALSSLGNYFFLIGLLLLVGLLFFGVTIRGTRGWFSLGGLTIQPVEFIKIALIIFLAKYFSAKTIKTNPVRHLIISGTGSLLFIFLVIMQPDFGSAMLLFLLWAAMLLSAGINKKYFVVIGLVIALTAGGGWLFFFKTYQKERIMTFFNPTADPLDQGYNINQAIIAVGSGRYFGRGIGFGSQSQLKFLPESQNDFIFAVIAEELGFFGVGLVLFFFTVIFIRLFKALAEIKNDFGIYFIIGSATLIFIEMFINIGMNIGLLPVIGISLPFVSYGGSSILSSLIMVGIAESVIVRSRMSY